MPFAIIDDDISCLQAAEKLFDLAEIDLALDRIAEQLNQRFSNQSILLINILQGGTLTAASLLLKLKCVLTLDSIYASRYRNQIHGNQLEWKNFPSQNLQDRTILLVDDIFDEGITLEYVTQYCLGQGAREVISMVLLEKQHERKPHAYRPDYVALQVPDKYVFGFGLDFHGRYRNAPGIYALNT